MYKRSHEVIYFIKETMETRRVEFTAGGRSFAETNTQRGIFRRDALLLLLFIIIMMTMNHILRKCTDRYKLSILLENVNHLMYIKLFVKKI